MSTHSYIGYLGRLAVAVAAAAAISAGTPGIAYAETEAASSAADAGPEKPKVDKDTNTTDKVTDDKADDSAEDKTATELEDDAGKKPSPTKKLRQSAEDFEAEQVARLSALFTPRDAATDDEEQPSPKRDGDAAEDEAAVQDSMTEARPVQEPTGQPADEAADGPVTAAAAAPVPWNPDPFRPNDPEPDDMPAAVRALRNLLVGAAAPQFRPYVREGVEAVYRGSQIVPLVNTVVPAYKIVPAFIEAARGNRSGAQVVINELLKTTGPVSLLYYGYDEIADLANREYEARLLKERFYSTVWDTLDPLALLHVQGEHGLRG